MGAFGWPTPEFNRFGTVQRQCSGKRWYASKAEAKAEARRLRRSHGRQLRPYACPVCLGWHLAAR